MIKYYFDLEYKIIDETVLSKVSKSNKSKGVRAINNRVLIRYEISGRGGAACALEKLKTKMKSNDMFEYIGYHYKSRKKT